MFVIKSFNKELYGSLYVFYILFLKVVNNFILYICFNRNVKDDKYLSI